MVKKKVVSDEKLKIRDYILISFFSIVGLFSKRIISPFANGITDFFRVPGGSLVSGFSFLFLLIGIVIINKKYVGSYMGILQGFLAIILGISSFQGMYAIIIYGLPGIVMDMIWNVFKALPKKISENNFCILVVMGASANVTGSILTNSIIFHLHGELLILWYLVSIFSGASAGIVSEIIIRRLKTIRKY